MISKKAERVYMCENRFLYPRSPPQSEYINRKVNINNPGLQYEKPYHPRKDIENSVEM